MPFTKKKVKDKTDRNSKHRSPLHSTINEFKSCDLLRWLLISHIIVCMTFLSSCTLCHNEICKLLNILTLLICSKIDN